MISQVAYPVQLSDVERAMVYKMETLENSTQIETDDGKFIHTKMGINAEPQMTRAFAALLTRDKQDWSIQDRYTDSRLVSQGKGLVWFITKTVHDRLPCSLVVTPRDTLETWRKELDATGLKYAAVKKLSILEKISLDDYDVVVVTPPLFNTVNNLAGNRVWKRLIIDDPRNINIPNMARPVAGFYWLISENPVYLVTSRRSDTNRLIKDIIGLDLDVEEKFRGLILRA